MNELDALRQEAETLKNAIRVSISFFILSYIIIIIMVHIVGIRTRTLYGQCLILKRI